jgi:tetratricopeptide (TPR) repeat protein
MSLPTHQADPLWLQFTQQAEAALTQQRLDEAEKRLLAALGVAQERCPHLVNETMSRLGHVYLQRGKLADAERLFEQSHDFEGLATACEQQGRLTDAIRALEQALAWQQQHEVRERTTTRKRLASLLLRAGRAAAAERVLRHILAAEEQSADYSWSVLPTLEHLAQACELLGHYAHAVEVVERTLDLYETHHAVYGREIIPTLRRLSLLCELAGDLDRAEELVVRGLDRTAEASPGEVGSWMLRLAALAEGRGEHDEACGLYRELLDCHPPSDAAQLFMARTALARNLCRTGGLEEAEALYAHAFRTAGEAVPALTRALASHDLATLYASSGRADKAAEALAASAADATAWEERPLEASPEVLRSLEVVAASLRSVGCSLLEERVRHRAARLRGELLHDD